MGTIRDIKIQIQAHERAKEFHHEKYLNNLQIIDDKIDRIEKQMEKQNPMSSGIFSIAILIGMKKRLSKWMRLLKL